MSWGIRVSFKSMKLLVLGHLSNKAFKEIFFTTFFFRLGTFLLLKLFFLLLFEEFLFFLPFLLDIFLHVHDFVLNWIEFLMKFLILVCLSVELLFFLWLCFECFFLVTLKQFRRTGGFGKLPELPIILIDCWILRLQLVVILFDRVVFW